MRGVVTSAALGVALLACSLATVSAQPSQSSSQDPAAGAQVFSSKGCVKCHAVDGVGGKVGPDLARTTRPHSFFDLATAMWNHLPRMADRMKQAGIDRPKLDERETADLVGYLYSLNYFDRPGNRENGRRLFTEKRCVVCHQAGGTGGSVGPPLDSFRQFKSPIFVAAAMWNHGPQMAEAMKEKSIERPRFTGQELRDLIAFVAPSTSGPSQGPIYALPGRAESGRLLFADKQCVQCHSVGGEGGKVGPDLVDAGVRRTPVEFAAAMWNKAPAMSLAMQQRGITLPSIKPEEMADIVSYLYSVRYFAGGSVSGGWKVMADKGCLQCHGVHGERGKPASDLTKSKALDSPAAIIAALWNHTLVTPTVAGTKAAWPTFQPKEMADLVALLQAFGVHDTHR